MLRFVILFSVLALVRSQTTPVSQCIVNDGPLPLNVYVDGCTTPPCLLPQLEDAVINVVFVAPRVLTDMATLANATVVFIFPITIPYELGANGVTCNFLENTHCPLLAGEVVIYKLKMFIEPFFPVDTQATVEFRIADMSTSPSSTVWCIRLPIQITQPKSRSQRNDTGTHLIV